MVVYRLAPFLFSLASLTCSAPLTCEQLTQPAEQLDPGNLEGTWALVAGSISFLPYLEIFSKRDSASINFPKNKSLTHTSYSRGFRIENTCQFSSSNITLNGSSFTFDESPESTSSSVFVQTSCPDCLIMRFIMESGNRTHLYLFSRRRGLEQNEIQEFKEQVKCLQMPPPTLMDPTKELCPWPEESRKD
ncbi:hypothetical protein NL108_005099 [Boleophthalmus pectinirostris]|nr:hypothetical protein NL108_005099 [Boleophthalmus pectinirostris]